MTVVTAQYDPRAVLIVMAFTVAVCAAVHLFAFIPIMVGVTTIRLAADHRATQRSRK